MLGLRRCLLTLAIYLNHAIADVASHRSCGVPGFPFSSLLHLLVINLAYHLRFWRAFKICLRYLCVCRLFFASTSKKVCTKLSLSVSRWPCYWTPACWVRSRFTRLYNSPKRNCLDSLIRRAAVPPPRFPYFIYLFFRNDILSISFRDLFLSISESIHP